MLTLVIVPGALPLILAELTANGAASCVVCARLTESVWPPGTVNENGEPEVSAPVLGSKVIVCVASGPELYGKPPPAAAVEASNASASQVPAAGLGEVEVDGMRGAEIVVGDERGLGRKLRRGGVG